jgi:S-adenosylmethionine:tRNA ribosyltransferase-isomerase
LKTDLFDYPLPEHLIAQKPADRRDESRLLVVHRHSHTVEHRHFRDLPEYLRAGDCLFRNNAAVIPARLHALRPTGGQVECLLLRPLPSLRPASRPEPSLPPTGRPGDEPGVHREVSAADRGDPSGLHRLPPRRDPRNDDRDEWWCLLRPGKKLPVGATFGRAGIFTGTVLEKTADGLVRVAFATGEGNILAVANRVGEMPLPPYIQRYSLGRSLLAGDSAATQTGNQSSPASRLLHSDEQRLIDRERYQTVYADRAHQVAAAAPTAGLHFTPELLAKIAAQGVACADLTLHVGLGTFRPIATEQIEEHDIHREVYEIPAGTQQALFTTQGRRIAVGTTSVRTIEDYLARKDGRGSGLPTSRSEPVAGNAFNPFLAEAGIFIYPPRTFQGVDALITNFHQPRSTLLCLVSAFLTPGSTEGVAWLKEIYADAVARNYRFFSYGDAMLIV